MAQKEKEEKKMKNKTAIITGGGRGIGKEITILLGKQGANVVVCSRTESEINSAWNDSSTGLMNPLLDPSAPDPRVKAKNFRKKKLARTSIRPCHAERSRRVRAGVCDRCRRQA